MHVRRKGTFSCHNGRAAFSFISWDVEPSQVSGGVLVCFCQFSFSRRIPMVSYSCLRSSLSFPLFNITNPIVNEAIVTGFGEVVCTIAFLISHFRSVLQLQNQFVVIRNARRMRAF